ncbi:MAG TPA: polymer-forming cytoskeletal protein [Woeseiaceae bacterium]|nr:polymer-forming cytoskeletal protein [Woeseiaceae bacterium]
MANSLYDDADPASSPSAGPPDSHGARFGASVFGATMVLKGDLSLAEDLIIEGSFDGSITQGDQRLSIGEHARVNATIRTGSAIIAGNVIGDVRGSRTVIVKKTARLHGALTAQRLCLESGANLEDVVLSGNIARTKDTDG